MGEELAKRGQNWHEPVELDDEGKLKALAYLREHQDASLREVAEETGLHRADIKLTRENDEAFAHDYREARGYGEEQVINQTRKLALEGVQRPLISAGKLVTYPKGHPQEGEIVYETIQSEKLLELMYRSVTAEGKALTANKMGIEINVPKGAIQVQSGASTADVLAFMQEHVTKALAAQSEAPEGTVEVVDESDEPVSG